MNMNRNSRRHRHALNAWKPAAALCMALTASGCISSEPPAAPPVHAPQTVEVSVTGIDEFGDVLLDVRNLNFEYGDSVDIEFSGGYKEAEVPVYPEFYGNKGDHILTDYYKDYIVVAGIACDFADETKIEAGETAVITIDEPAKYRELYEAYDIDPNWEQRPGQTTEEYLNAWNPVVGTLGKGILYRGSSPFDEQFRRVDEMGEYLEREGIRTIVSLSETSAEEIDQERIPEYTRRLIREGNVIFIPLGIDYRDPEAMKRIGEGLKKMTETEGPYMIQCSYGRDRTGVICALLEGLCGAAVKEIADDYMLSYKNLHEVPMEPEALQYRLYYTRVNYHTQILK